MIPSNTRLARKRNLPFFLPLIVAFLIVFAAVWFLRLILQVPSDQMVGTPVATFTIPAGQARMVLGNGMESMIDASSPINLLNLNVGEGIETIGSARVELTLQDGSVVRMDGGSFITIEGYKSIDNRKTIDLLLNKGNIWIRTSTEGKIDKFTILAGKSRLLMKEGIFAVSRNSLEDLYRGIKGVANIDVLQNDTVLSTFPINLGAQLRVTDHVVDDLANKKQLDLLTLIDDNFRNSDWYSYNSIKDNNGYVFIPPINGNGETTFNGNENVSISNNNGAGTVRELIPVISVLSPTEGSTVTDDIVTIKGEVSSSAEKVFVDDYQLSKYVPGQTSWIYKASLSLGNLKPGRNVYAIYAESLEGIKSAVVQYSFYYQPAINTNMNNAVTSERLSAPIFTKPTKGDPYVTTENKVVISGTVGTGAAKVVVNGYTLSKYIPGSGVWNYNAYEEYETLKEGVNTYTVYAVDSAGNKSPSVTLTITYNKPPIPPTGSGSGI